METVLTLVYAVCDVSAWFKFLFAIINIVINPFINCEWLLFLLISLWCLSAEVRSDHWRGGWQSRDSDDATNSSRKCRRVNGKDRNRVLGGFGCTCTLQGMSETGETCRIWSENTKEKWRFQPLLLIPAAFHGMDEYDFQALGCV